MPDSETIFLFSGQDMLLPDKPESGPRPGPGVARSLADPIPAIGVRRYPRDGALWEARALDESAAAAASSLGLERLPIRQAIGLFDDRAMRPALMGLALLHWLEGAVRCGACGAELVDPDGNRAAGSGHDGGSAGSSHLGGPGGPGLGAGEAEGLARRCPACGRAHFPRISPAVIVLVRKEGKALLAHNARFPAGRFGLIAGFVDPGETLEETVVREVREEAGIEIRNIRYRKSQPWPFPDSLMVAFTADWASGEARPDGVEIAELRWCGPDELPQIPPPGSVARALIDEFTSGSLP